VAASLEGKERGQGKRENEEEEMMEIVRLEQHVMVQWLQINVGQLSKKGEST
jgi:hypothetical protein